MGAPDPLAEIQRELESTRQHLTDTQAALTDRDDELKAARAANREVMAILNRRRR